VIRLIAIGAATTATSTTAEVGSAAPAGKGTTIQVKGVDGSLLGTIKRNDGTTQVIYNGHPLYYYAHEGPAQVLCQNVDEFGGLWLVVTPDGEPVRG
jgi:hypothetical protein